MQDEETADLQTTVTEQERELTELKAQVATLTQERGAYEDAVSTATAVIGHSGDQPHDLIDALGQIERLLDGFDLDAIELTGLAGKLRATCVQAASAGSHASD